ncbi:hypothetical protein SDC9_91266 [bioreactor metagenome]|uniref:Uncharacterized protein n=1 Tax=bioreactor metagenome TaxID=1076179 RepID=A0A644ZUZ7_9ZZZZ
MPPAAQPHVERRLAARLKEWRLRPVKAAKQHCQRRRVMPPFGALVDALDGRPEFIRQIQPSQPIAQPFGHGIVEATQLVGLQQRLGICRLRCETAMACEKLPCRLQRHAALLCPHKRQPCLASDIARGTAAPALRKRLHRHRRATVAQAADEIGQTVIQQVIAGLQQRYQSRHLRMQQLLRISAARGIGIFRKPPHQPPLLLGIHAPPCVAVKPGAQGRNRLGLHIRWWQRDPHRHGIAARALVWRHQLIQLVETFLQLQKIARCQALLQISQCPSMRHGQRHRLRRERAFVRLHRETFLHVGDLQRHHMARRGIVPRPIQRHYAHGADALGWTLDSGEDGLSKKVHAANIDHRIGHADRQTDSPYGTAQRTRSGLGNSYRSVVQLERLLSSRHFS